MSSAHKDHLLPTTIKHIAYNYPTIKYITGSEEVVKKLVECGVNKKNIFVLKPSKWFDIGIAKVKLEPLLHDTPNYALKMEYKGEKILYAIDTNEISHIEAKGYNLFLIESNYREDILEEHIKECVNNGDNENKLFYLNRAKSTHLSYEKANDFLINNMGKNSKFEYIHQSNYNFKED